MGRRLNTKDLFELAGDPRFIEGIYNYCDRWCERCPLTARCLLFAQEQADENDPEANDINNEAFWEKLKSIFEQTREMVTEIAKERGVDLDSLDLTETTNRERRLHERIESHELSQAAKQYAKRVNQWFDGEYPVLEQALLVKEGDLPLVDFDLQEKIERVADAINIIRWYQFQIAVKTMRGLRRSDDDDEDDPEHEDYDDAASEQIRQKNSDGSIKVALIGIDRSIAAWGRLKEEFPSSAATILPLLIHLEQLRRATEHEFPEARSFVRPGFDEALGSFVS